MKNAKTATLTLAALGVLGVLAGCKLYRPLPLDRKAKDAALAAPDSEHLRIEARQLRHPLLKPLALDPAAPLTPEGAAVLAVVANPDLRAVRDQRALASAQLLDAGLLPDPVLSYSRDVPAGGDDAGATPGHALQLSLDLTSLLTRSARVRAARSQQSSVDLDVAWQEWQVAEAAKMSVFRLATLEPQVGLAEASVAAQEEAFHAVEQAARSGALAQGDLAAARTVLDCARRDALTLAQARDSERITLNGLLGLPPGTRLVLAPEPSEWSPLPSEDELVKGLDSRLDLLALEKGYESEDARVRLAVWSQFPSIGISLSRARDTSNVVTRGTGVSMSLPFLNGSRGLVAVENATRRQLYDQYLSRLATARGEISQVLADHRATGAKLAAAREALADLEAQASGSETSWRAGHLDLLARNQARLALLAQKSTLLDLRRTLDELGVALELAAGRTLSVPAMETAR